MNETPRLPCDPDAELRVIDGALYPGGYERAVSIVTTEDFSTIGGQKIFAAMELLAATGRPLSMNLVEQALKDDPDFPHIFAVLESLNPFTPEAVTHYAKIVRELAHRRRLMRMAEELVNDLADVTVSINDAVQPLMKEITHGR